MRVLVVAILLLILPHPAFAQADQDKAAFSDTPPDTSQIAYADGHTNDNPMLILTRDPLPLPVRLPVYGHTPPPLAFHQPRTAHAFPADNTGQRKDDDQ